MLSPNIWSRHVLGEVKVTGGITFLKVICCEKQERLVQQLILVKQRVYVSKYISEMISFAETFFLKRVFSSPFGVLTEVEHWQRISLCFPGSGPQNRWQIGGPKEGPKQPFRLHPVYIQNQGPFSVQNGGSSCECITSHVTSHARSLEGPWPSRVCMFSFVDSVEYRKLR